MQLYTHLQLTCGYFAVVIQQVLTPCFSCSLQVLFAFGMVLLAHQMHQHSVNPAETVRRPATNTSQTMLFVLGGNENVLFFPCSLSQLAIVMQSYRVRLKLESSVNAIKGEGQRDK